MIGATEDNPVSWTDRGGVLHFVDDPNLVPAEYRWVSSRRELPRIAVYRGDFTPLGERMRGVKPAAKVAMPSPAPKGSPVRAMIYSAEWCTACHAAKDYLRSIGVDVVERDIDKDPTALSELSRLAGEKAAIPVIVIGNSVIPGFDRESLKAAIDRARR